MLENLPGQGGIKGELFDKNNKPVFPKTNADVEKTQPADDSPEKTQETASDQIKEVLEQTD